MPLPQTPLQREIKACRLCAARFAQTPSAHQPRPVVWYRPHAPILIAGQAPGVRVHGSGRPFDDPSGARLRDWLGVDDAQFYDQEKFAIVPMGFCFPGVDAKGSDLPPPKICHETWHKRVMAELGEVKMTILLGGAAMRWHIGAKTVKEAVENWRALAPEIFALPHPSWRNSGWLKRNPWFEEEVLPQLRHHVKRALT